MKIIWGIFLLFFYIILILASHIFIINFLPYPFNHINVIFVLSLLLLTVSSDRRIILLALIISYFSELFSSIPFGIGTFSLLSSLFIINWFQFNILTNRSISMIFLSAILGITLYRLLFIILLSIYNYFSSLPTLPYKEIITDAGWEILLSSLLLFLLYIINAKIIRLLRPSSRRNISMYG